MAASSTLPDLSLATAPDVRRRQITGRLFAVVLLLCTLFGLVMLGLLLVKIGNSGTPYLVQIVKPGYSVDNIFEEHTDIKIGSTTIAFNTGLLSNYHSRFPAKAGLKSALIGTVIVMILVALFTFPLGVGAAIYLEEYAPPNAITAFIKLNIYNLAGVPSIVYGMLGLAVFGRAFGLLEPGSSFVNALHLNIHQSGIHEFKILGLPFQFPFGNSLMAGELTMTLLVLPIVIISAREALRAVPSSIREAAYGLGATRWEVTSQQVIPVAMPGILTGMILALSRAMGESAPLLVMGAFIYVPFLPQSIWDKFTVLPLQIYNWISLPKPEFRVGLAGAGIMILLVVLLVMNGIAIYLRNRFEKKW